MVAVVEAEHAKAVVFEQTRAPVQRGKLVHVQEQGKDAVFEAVMAGRQPPMHHPAFIYA